MPSVEGDSAVGTVGGTNHLPCGRQVGDTRKRHEFDMDPEIFRCPTITHRGKRLDQDLHWVFMPEGLDHVDRLSIEDVRHLENLIAVEVGEGDILFRHTRWRLPIRQPLSEGVDHDDVYPRVIDHAPHLSR